jgi:hypothetical protein
MRVMLQITIPPETGNRAIKDGSLQKSVMDFMDRTKPEAAYFLPMGGSRGAIFFFDMKENSSMPAVAEPFFESLNASIVVTPAMSLDDLKIGLAQLKG